MSVLSVSSRSYINNSAILDSANTLLALLLSEGMICVHTMSKKPVCIRIPIQSITNPLLSVTSIQEKNIDYFANFANNISTSLCGVPAPGLKVRPDYVHNIVAQAEAAITAICYHDRQQHEL